MTTNKSLHATTQRCTRLCFFRLKERLQTDCFACIVVSNPSFPFLHSQIYLPNPRLGYGTRCSGLSCYRWVEWVSATCACILLWTTLLFSNSQMPPFSSLHFDLDSKIHVSHTVLRQGHPNPSAAVPSTDTQPVHPPRLLWWVCDEETLRCILISLFDGQLSYAMLLWPWFLFLSTSLPELRALNVHSRCDQHIS